MTIFANFRALVFLRRIARALERSATCDEERLRMDKERVAPRAKPRRSEFSELDVDAVSRAYEKRIAAEDAGVEIDQ